MRTNNFYLYLIIFVAILFISFWGFKSSNSIDEQNIFVGSNNALTDLQKDIVKKIRGGNMVGLHEYFDEEVSLTIFKESEFYPKQEAEERLSEFCQAYTTKKFLVKHYGGNQMKTSFYLIGELTTTEEKKLRVYISNNETRIESIEITFPRKDVN